MIETTYFYKLKLTSIGAMITDKNGARIKVKILLKRFFLEGHERDKYGGIN